MDRAPPHEPARHAFGRRIDDVDRFGPVEQALRPLSSASSPARLARLGLHARRGDPSARPLGQMAFLRLRPAHALRAELDRQPVDQPRHFAFARRLLDQAVLRGAEIFGPVGGQRESIEAELGVERRRLVGQQALQMLRLAAGDRCCDRRRGNAAVDPKAVQRQSPRAEVPLLQLPDERRGSAVRAPGSPLRDASPAPPA